MFVKLIIRIVTSALLSFESSLSIIFSALSSISLSLSLPLSLPLSLTFPSSLFPCLFLFIFLHSQPLHALDQCERPTSTAVTPTTSPSPYPYPFSPPIIDKFDDWVDDPCNSLCQGYYRETPLPFPDATPDCLQNEPTTITSNQANFLSEGNYVFKGNVHLIEGNRQLFADEAELFRNKTTYKSEKVEARGNVRITEPGLRIDGTFAQYEIPIDEKFIENATFRLYGRHARGTAANITIYGKERMTLNNATYTTCKPCFDTWILKAKVFKLNKKTGRGQAKHAFLFIDKIPIGYFPYVNFPIDDRRQTGFLHPSLESTTESGVIVSVPFYWNIAPNYDATITSKYLSRRGGEIDGQFRYLSQLSHGYLQGAILPHDRDFENFKRVNLASHPLYSNTDPRVQGLNKPSTRTCFGIKHTTLFNPHLRFNVDYKTVSDNNYLNDLDTPFNLPPNTNQLLREGELQFNWNHWSGFAKLQNYQTLYPFDGPLVADVYERVPEFAAKGVDFEVPINRALCNTSEFGSSDKFERFDRFDKFDSVLKFDIDTNFTHFNHRKDYFTGNTFTVGDRTHLRPAVSLPIIDPGWFITPRLQYDMLFYNVKVGTVDFQKNAASHPTRTTPMFDVNSGLIFEREFLACENLYIQTLEPRVYYLYVPYRNFNDVPNFDTTRVPFDYNQLYRDNRFAGLDRVGDTNQITLGVVSRFLDFTTGQEKAMLGAGQIFFFEKRRVTAGNQFFTPNVTALELPQSERHYSPLAAIGALKITPVLFGHAQIDWNTYNSRLERNFFALQFHPHPLTVYNAGFQYIRKNPYQLNPITFQPENLKQIDFSVAHKLSEKLRILGHWHYDLRYHRTPLALLGFELQGCCLALRLSAQRELLLNNGILPQGEKRYQNSVFFQIVFKGFAGVGNKSLHNRLKNHIPGYEWVGEAF